MQHDAPDELHIVMPLANGAHRRLPHHRVGFRKQGIQTFPLGQPRLKGGGLTPQRLVRQGVDLPLQGIDLIHHGL